MPQNALSLYRRVTSTSDDPEISKLIERANSDFDSLSSDEVLRLQMVFYNHFSQWNVAFSNNEAALFDTEKWGLVAHGYGFFMQHSPALKHMWKYCGWGYDQAFRDHVDQIITEVEKAPKPASDPSAQS